MNPAKMFKDKAKYISEGIRGKYLRFTSMAKFFVASAKRIPALREGLCPMRLADAAHYHIFA